MQSRACSSSCSLHLFLGWGGDSGIDFFFTALSGCYWLKCVLTIHVLYMPHIRHLLPVCVSVCVSVLSWVWLQDVLWGWQRKLHWSKTWTTHTHTYIWIHMCVSGYVYVRAPLGQSTGGLNNNLIFHHFHYSATATEREWVGETKRETVGVGERVNEAVCVPQASKMLWQYIWHLYCWI